MGSSPRQLGLPARPWIVGHRGAAGEAPENSLRSLELAGEQGADMVELDLQLTADGELVAFHDWELERLTGRAGVVEELPYDALRGAMTASPRAGKAGEPIARLAEVLAALPPELPLNLELKRRRADPDRLVAALAAGVRNRGRLLVSSFDWQLLERLRRRLPELPLAPLAKRDPDGLLAAAERLRAFSVHCHRRLADAGLVARAAAQGRPLLVYTVNDPEEARTFLGRGAAGLFTDLPGRLRAALAEAA